jgi:hypothetical protein
LARSLFAFPVRDFFELAQSALLHSSPARFLAPVRELARWSAFFSVSPVSKSKICRSLLANSARGFTGRSRRSFWLDFSPIVPAPGQNPCALLSLFLCARPLSSFLHSSFSFICCNSSLAQDWVLSPRFTGSDLHPLPTHQSACRVSPCP